ncbi:MAG: hypothetical protein HYZ75_12300 [Elusimicrobia bacterium]|nr:hypothetical protein [Elusimicrobiota bacterium]
MRLWLLHPIAVHLPVALLLTGFAFHARALWKGDGEWTAPASRWLLWLGTAGAWAALGLGLLAERTAPHVPSAWEVLGEHETLAYWTCGVFSAVSAAAVWSARKGEAGPRWGRAALAVLWLAGLGLLVATAEHGGRLVFDHNMGTAASAE